MTQLRRSLLLALPTLLLAGFAGAGDLRPVTETELRMTSVPEAPNAPAVVLFKKGTFSLIDEKTGRFSPSFTIEVRRKILTEEGKKYGEALVFHSKQAKLQDLQGRTVLPDGREVPLPKDAVFKRRLSRSEKLFTTSIAFPAVEVGAILDYRVRLRVFSLFAVEPWYFHEEVPTLFSEITYDIPRLLTVRSYISNPLKANIQQGSTGTLEGGRIWAYARNLPAVPDEPFGPPFEDMASWYLIAPVGIKAERKPVRLLETWATTCELYGDEYDKALKKSTNAARRATEIAGSGEPRTRAEALYRFVRDQIETEDLSGVGLPEDTTADSVLAAKKGGPRDRDPARDPRIPTTAAWPRSTWRSTAKGASPARAA